MTKKILILILVAGLILVSGLVLWSMEKKQKPEPTKQELLQKFQTLKTQHEKAKSEGYDVSEVGRLGRAAKRAFNRGDYKKANELLEKASRILADMTKESPTPFVSPKPTKLSQVKVASFYQTITDGDMISRSVDEVTAIFKETKTDMIFRGFWRWNPVPEYSDALLPSEFPDEYMKEAIKRGYTYQQLKSVIDKIKADIPSILFTGGVTTQRLNKIERNPITGNILKQKQTWEMAFNPEKWNLSTSKEETQCKLAKSWHWISPYINCLDDYNPEKAPAYFPDITNEEYQKLLLSWAKKQIDSGVNAIWIDMLFKQANIIEKSDPGHPAVKESFEASSKIVDEIHNYGKSRGKPIYVGTWWNFVELPYFPPNIDFVTATPSSEEVLNKKLDLDKWVEIKSKVELIEKKLGKKIPIFTFIDVGNDKLPIAVFSQNLTPAEQREFLEHADEFYSKLDIHFVYPIHGGFMGQSAEKLSFGEWKIYDSLAPEFQTYETIKELALKKTGVECGNGTCESGDCDSCPQDCEPTKALPSGLSPDVENEYIERGKWLDEKLIEWKPTEYKPMHFIGFHLPLSGAMRDYTNSDDDMAFLDMLDEAGVDIISVGIIGAPEDLDESLIERYDKVFTEIRKRNKKLKIWFRSFIYSPKKKPQKVFNATEYIIKRWHPDYYVIIHEPKGGDEKAKSYLKWWVEKACKIAKDIDPEVKTSVTAINSPKGIDYVDVFVEIPCIDIIGFDIYNLWGLCEECDGGNIIEDKIKLIHSKGKEAWIEELWLTSQWAGAKPPEMSPGFNDPSRAWWDSRFIRVMSYYAQKNNLIGVEPWFTTYFILYPGYDIWKIEGKKQIPTDRYLEDFRNALTQKRRTPTFCAFKAASEEAKSKTGE